MSGPNPDLRQAIEETLTDWERRQRVAPGWTVSYDTGDGCYRTTFTVNPGATSTERRYGFTEVEMCQYVIGLADLAPHIAGPSAIRLAELSREEIAPCTCDQFCSEDPRTACRAATRTP